jgi:hypothetical protein
MKNRFTLHEDHAAVVVGLGIVMLALAVTWLARPAERPGDRDAHPKGWPTPLAATVGMMAGCEAGEVLASSRIPCAGDLMGLMVP